VIKKLIAKEIEPKLHSSLKEIGKLLDSDIRYQLIDIINWQKFLYKPEVKFAIAYFNGEIFIKYKVKEKYIRALETQTNGEVYKDSCVEFFVSFDGKNYYNFEFSCIGTIHLTYGAGRNNRQFIDPEIIGHIEIESTLGVKPFTEKKGGFNWELIVRIPTLCFSFNQIKTLKGINATANFYKCGDGTSEPHFLTWNPIKTKNPDYHRPEFFGNLQFE